MPAITSKLLGPSQPMQHESTLRRNGELLERLRKAKLVPITRSGKAEETSFRTSARELVRYFLSALAPASAEPACPASKDLANLGKAVGSIMQAAEDNILSDAEAEAVVNYITQRFVERRFDDVLKTISTSHAGGWFLVGDHVCSQQD